MYISYWYIDLPYRIQSPWPYYFLLTKHPSLSRSSCLYVIHPYGMRAYKSVFHFLPVFAPPNHKQNEKSSWWQSLQYWLMYAVLWLILCVNDEKSKRELHNIIYSGDSELWQVAVCCPDLSCYYLYLWVLFQLEELETICLFAVITYSKKVQLKCILESHLTECSS